MDNLSLTMKLQTQYSVFVADDDDRFLMKVAFDRFCPEARINFAVDGLDLMEALGDSLAHPCLIILDLNMPRLNGLESLQVLRANPVYLHTPIIVFSTSDHEQDKFNAHQKGADEYIVRPVEMNSLADLVNKLKEDWNLAECH
jgi:DNA-binding response OmpR family regulator